MLRKIFAYCLKCSRLFGLLLSRESIGGVRVNVCEQLDGGEWRSLSQSGVCRQRHFVSDESDQVRSVAACLAAERSQLKGRTDDRSGRPDRSAGRTADHRRPVSDQLRHRGRQRPGTVRNSQHDTIR